MAVNIDELIRLGQALTVVRAALVDLPADAVLLAARTDLQAAVKAAAAKTALPG